MPVEIERKLKATARKRGYGKERTGAYVYGTMRKIEHGGDVTPADVKRKAAKR